MEKKETILLVDDEDMIIDVGEQLVEKMRYKISYRRVEERQ